MSIPGYAQWVDRHATVFGINTDAELKTMLSWESAFHGVSAVLLTEATAWLAAHPEEFATCDVRFHGKMVTHLRLLKHFVSKRTQQAKTAPVEQWGPRAPRAEWLRLRAEIAGSLAIPEEKN